MKIFTYKIDFERKCQIIYKILSNLRKYAMPGPGHYDMGAHLYLAGASRRAGDRRQTAARPARLTTRRHARQHWCVRPVRTATDVSHHVWSTVAGQSGRVRGAAGQLVRLRRGDGACSREHRNLVFN